MTDKQPERFASRYATDHYDLISKEIARHEQSYQTYRSSVEAINPGRVAELSLEEYIRAAAHLDGMLRLEEMMLKSAMRIEAALEASLPKT